MALPKPRTKSEIFWASTAPHEIGSAISGFGGSAASAARFFLNDPPLIGWGMLATVGALGSVGAQILKARKSVSKEVASAQDDLMALSGCLHTLQAVVEAGVTNTGFRTTVHAAEGDELIQCVEYVGDQRKTGTLGRRTPIHCGVIGKVYRERDALVGWRETDNHQDFVNQMIKEYGFDKTRAKALDQSTQSWMAAPLGQSEKDVGGVLYCDSIQRDFFTEERQRAIAYAAIGIAFFVAKAYPS